MASRVDERLLAVHQPTGHGDVETFGSGLNTPTAILQSRIVSLGAQWHS